MTENLDMALDFFTQAAKLKPTDSFILNNFAVTQMMKNDFANSTQNLEKVYAQEK